MKRLGVLLLTSFFGGCIFQTESTPEMVGSDDVLSVSIENDSINRGCKSKKISGCWSIHQTNRNGDRYNGVLSIIQEGNKVSGTLDWANHADGIVEGTFIGRHLYFAQTFADRPGLVGYYNADLDRKKKVLVDGTTLSNGGDTGIWEAISVACATP